MKVSDASIAVGTVDCQFGGIAGRTGCVRGYTRVHARVARTGRIDG